MDLTCCGCGRNLRGLSCRDECPECALAVARSMSVQATRSGASAPLHQLAAGLDAQQWAAMLGLLLAVGGRFFLHASFQLPVWTGLFAAGLSLLGTLLMCGSWRKLPGDPCQRCHARERRVVMAAGSGALILCTLPLSLTYATPVTPLLSASFMLCSVCWFAGEVSRLRFVQEVASYICDSHTRREARSLRWGVYLLLAILVIPMIQSLTGHNTDDAIVTPGNFLMLASVSLLLFSLLIAFVCGQASRVVQQQAFQNEMLERGTVVVQTVSGPWRLVRSPRLLQRSSSRA